MTTPYERPSDVEVLASAGFRIEGPGSRVDGELSGRFWWTLFRDGWSGVECGNDFATEAEAVVDAICAMLVDEDIDVSTGIPRPEVTQQFPAEFSRQFAAWIAPHGSK